MSLANRIVCGLVLPIVFLPQLLAGCSKEDLTSLTSLRKGEEPLPPQELQAAIATPAEDQWEYLVVSFGETEFNAINQSIQMGTSKLVAFREFSDLLSGHEGIDLQARLDILGRFGWELVDTIGVIGGDQELLLRRKRIEDRISKEQDAIKALGAILRKETEQRDKALQEYLAQQKQEVTHPKADQLIELDAAERLQREIKAQDAAVAAITALLPKASEQLGPKASFRAVDVAVSTTEYSKSNMTYSGTITIAVNGTDALLQNGNAYRKSEAEALAKTCQGYIKKQLQGFDGEYTFDNNFRINCDVEIGFTGSWHAVSYSYETIEIPNFPSRW